MLTRGVAGFLWLRAPAKQPLVDDPGMALRILEYTALPYRDFGCNEAGARPQAAADDAGGALRRTATRWNATLELDLADPNPNG